MAKQIKSPAPAPAPAPAPKLKLQLVADTGSSSSDGITSKGALLASGVASGDVLNVRYSNDGGLHWTAWSKTGAAIASPSKDGNWIAQVQELTSKGKLVASTSLSFTLDTSVNAPTLTLVKDTGLAGDGLTADGHVLAGALSAGAAVQYSTDGGASWTSAFAAHEGANTVLAHQVDVAGNVSTAAVLAFTLDTTAPEAADDTATTQQDASVTIAVADNDDDANGVTVTEAGAAANGSVVLNADGTIDYTPDAGFTGTDTFSYVVTDAAGLQSVATVQVTVEAPPPVDPPPVDPPPVDPPPVDPPPADTSAFTPLDPAAAGAATVCNALLATSSGIEINAGSMAWHASGAASTQLYDGSLLPLGIGAGLLLTSGTTPGNANTVQWFGTDNTGDGPFDNGDADLDTVVNSVFSTVSYDATTLSFSFQVTDPAATSVSFDLVFGSDEFPEWVDQYVDVAVVLVNGQNVALFDHDAQHPLSVIGSNLAGGYFIDNAAGQLPIEYDGVSAHLKIVAPIHAGTNTLKIGIGDTGDHIYDSGIFIANLAAGNLPGSGVLIDDNSGTDGQDTSTGGGGSDLIDTQGGDDIVNAGAGDDIVIAGAGDDHIAGGTGSDQLVGGAGADEFDYSDLHDWAVDGLDTIADFSGNSVVLNNASNLDAITGDVLVFSYAALAGLPGAVLDGFTAHAADRFSTLADGSLSARNDGQADAAHAQFVYDAATGIVGFDADGTGSAAALQVTLIGTLPAQMQAAWFVIGD